MSMNSHLHGLNKKVKHLLLEYICFWFDDEFFKMLTQKNSVHQTHWRFYFCILSRKESGKLCCTFLLRTLVLRGRVANAELHTQGSAAGVKCPRTTLVSKQQQQKSLYVLLTENCNFLILKMRRGEPGHCLAEVWLSCRVPAPIQRMEGPGFYYQQWKKKIKTLIKCNKADNE